MKLITTHKGSDFDALASLVAATLLYEDCVGVLPDSVNTNVKTFLAIHKDVLALTSPKEIDFDDVDTLIITDTHSWDRLDHHFAVLKDQQELHIVIWDHHLKGSITGRENHVREIGSTTTMLVKQLQEKQISISPIQATLFLLGIYEDTGHLSFPSTLPEDAYAAGFLLSCKGDLNLVANFLRQSYGSRQKEILQELLEDVQKEEMEGVSIGFAIKEIKGRVKNLAMVLQMYREIINVDAVFGLFLDVEHDRCMIIGRSAVEFVDVGRIMRDLGGGGHPGAGSAQIKGGHPVEIKETILEKIRDYKSSVGLKDIMSSPVKTVKETMTMEEVAKTLRREGCTGLPVVNAKDEIVGVISRRDFKRLTRENQLQSPVKAFMSWHPVAVDIDKTVTEVIQIMTRKDIGRIPIIKDGKFVGIVTRSDIMGYFYSFSSM